MDSETLANTVTRIVMERLGAAKPDCPTTASVVTFGDVPACVVGGGMDVRAGTGPADVAGADYIVLTQASFRSFHGGIPAGIAASAPGQAVAGGDSAGGSGAGGTFDLSGKKVVGEADVRHLGLVSGCSIKVGPSAIVTALAKDFITNHGAQVVR